MEKEPKFETPQNPEEELAMLLIEKGPENPEAMERLVEWTKEQEEAVKKADDYPLAQLEFKLKQARLYLRIGQNGQDDFMECACESFNDALTQAFNERRRKLFQEIRKEMKGIAVVKKDGSVVLDWIVEFKGEDDEW